MNSGMNLDLILILGACVVGFLLYQRMRAPAPRPILAPAAAPAPIQQARTSLVGGMIRTAEDHAYDQADQLIVGGLAKLKVQRFAQDLQAVAGSASAVPTAPPPAAVSP